MTSTDLRELRHQLTDTLEDFGQVLGFLREATADAERGSMESAALVANDALELLSSLEAQYSAHAARLARLISTAPQPA